MKIIGKVFAVLLSLCFMAGPAYSADAPATYKKCKACHGVPGELGKKKMGPNLALSQMNFEQFLQMVKIGSEWEGRPPKMAGFEKKKMKPVGKLTDDDVKAIFEYSMSAMDPESLGQP